MGTRPRVTKCWQVISCDLCGPLPRTANGYEYILVVTDYFSQFLIIIPMRAATAKIITKEIKERVFLTFGVPEYVITDNRTQFGGSKDFNKFLAGYGIKPFYNPFYTPQNNPTERVNRTIKTALLAYVGQNHRRWDEHLAKVA